MHKHNFINYNLFVWGIIPFGQGLTLFDFELGILYTLALSSLGVFGILFAGWSANSYIPLFGPSAMLPVDACG